MRTLTILFALLLAMPLSARADDAASLLAKHHAYVGWQFGDGTLPTEATDGAAYYLKNGSFKTLYTFHKLRAGIAYRSDVEYSGKRPYHGASGFTGRIYWASGPNGFTRPELGDVQKFNLAYDLLVNEATTRLTGSVQGTATVDGAATTIVRVTDPNAYPIDLYIDPQTGAYKRAVIDPGGLYASTMNILAYTDALPGKKVISKWSWGSSKNGYIEISKITPNVAVTAQDLHPPKPTAYWTFGSTPAKVRTTEDRIYVTASVNGVEGNFILDTGDGAGMLLNKDFAARANVKEEGAVTGYGIGGTARESIIHIDKLQVGGSTLHNIKAQSQDIGYKGFLERNGMSADGLIGYDLLAGAVVDLNLDNGTLLVQNPQTTTIDPQKGLLAVVDLSGAIPKLPMKVDGIDVNAELDSGNAGPVLYGPDLRSKYGLTVMTRLAKIGGVGGWQFAQCGSFGTVTIGPISYRGVSGCEDQAWPDRSILVGFDFLRNFNYIFDYPQAQIVLIPRQNM